MVDGHLVCVGVFVADEEVPVVVGMNWDEYEFLGGVGMHA